MLVCALTKSCSTYFDFNVSKDVQGDGHCGIWAIIDQLHQQGIHATLQSVRGETAAWLSDKEYAWSQFPQDDAKD